MLEEIRSLHLRIERNADRWSLSIYNDGLNVSEKELRPLACAILRLENTERQLGDRTITRRYSDGPIVRVVYELTEPANA